MPHSKKKKKIYYISQEISHLGIEIATHDGFYR